MKLVKTAPVSGVPASEPEQTWEKLRGMKFNLTLEVTGTELIALHDLSYHVSGSPENSCRRITNELREAVLAALALVDIDGRRAEILHQYSNIDGSLNCKPPTLPL